MVEGFLFRCGGWVLVGRDAELKMLTGLLEAVDGDAASLILQVAGEPGIGKTRLLRELRVRAQNRGHLVLTGRAAEFEAEQPFGVFSAIDDWLLGLEHEHLEQLSGGLAAELAVVFPAFGVVATERYTPLREERYRAYRAVRGLLSSLAGDAPVVLVLDDVQWADPGSLELVSYLLAYPPGGAVLMALGFRPAQICPHLSAALAASLREDRSQRVDLVPLAGADADELLGSEMPSRVREHLYRESGGNPFYLLQLARAVVLAGPRPAPGDPAGTVVPEAVRAALASELVAVPAPALVLLQGASVAGDPFDEELAACAAEVADADALDLIDELLKSQLIHPSAAPGRFAFRHPIVRASVYESAGGAWRAGAHARLARRLASRGASATAQAPHVERSARQGDPGAVAVLTAAGVADARRAPALSARWYGAALRLLPDAAQTEHQRIELLVAAATAHGGSGQSQASHEALLEALARMPADDPGRIPIIAYCARIEHLLGRHREAYARVAQAHRALADHASPAAVTLKTELAAGCFYASRDEQMRSWSEQALDAAVAIEDRPLELVAAALVAYSGYTLGRPAAQETERASALLDAIDDKGLAVRLDGAMWVGWVEAFREHYDRSIDHCQRAIDLGRATGQGTFVLNTMMAQAWSLTRTGRLAEAEELVTAAIEAGRVAPSANLSTAVGMASRIASEKGNLDEALSLAEDCARLVGSIDQGQLRARTGLYLAAPLIEMGEARRARDAVLSTGGGADLPLHARVSRCAAYELLTRAELLMGRPDAAELWARKASEETHGEELALETAWALRAAAAVALARDEAPQAAKLAFQAAARTAAVGAPIETARSQILAARALVQAGQRDQAVASLELAAQELRRLGAHGYRAEAEKELRRLGRRVKRRHDSGDGLSSLTERERDIAELVSRGHTNREIAAASYLSERTVERHLSRIFAKLGVSSRSRVASLVAADAD